MIGNPITIPAISIRHLNQATREWLHRRAFHLPFMVASHTNGFFLTLPIEDDWDELPADLTTLVKAYSDEKHWPPFGWIMLDVDGDVVPELPVYD